MNLEENLVSQSAPESYRVELPAHIRLADCYQCGKCTAGCPVSGQMDLAPSQIMRMVQLGRAETALRSEAIWKCVACQTCSARCPKNVDCAGVMDALRESSLAHGLSAASQQPVIAFQSAFLDNIRRNGRLNELQLIAQFKMAVFSRTGRLAFLFKDAGLAPQLSKRKKLHLFPAKVRDRKVVERIFSKCAGASSK